MSEKLSDDLSSPIMERPKSPPLDDSTAPLHDVESQREKSLKKSRGSSLIENAGGARFVFLSATLLFILFVFLCATLYAVYLENAEKPGIESVEKAHSMPLPAELKQDDPIEIITDFNDAQSAPSSISESVNVDDTLRPSSILHQLDHLAQLVADENMNNSLDLTNNLLISPLNVTDINNLIQPQSSLTLPSLPIADSWPSNNVDNQLDSTPLATIFEYLARVFRTTQDQPINGDFPLATD